MMLLRNIFLKNLRDRRVAFLWWSIGFFSLVFMVSSVYPTIQESAADLEAYVESLPDALKAAFGVEGAALTSPIGYLNAELFTLMVPIMFLVFTIGFGSSAIAGEEEAGTLDLLLANPMTRWRLVLEKFLSMVVGTSVLGLVLWVSLVIGAQSFDIEAGYGPLAAASVSSVLLGLCFGTAALAGGCITGRKGLAIAISMVFTLGSYLLNIFSKIVEYLEPYEKLSIFYYNLNADPLSNGLRFGDISVFLGLIAFFLAVAVYAFQRRDLSV